MNRPEILLVLGSRNRKKCREMAELVSPPWEPNEWLSRLETRSVDEFSAAPEVVEGADTFAGNARKKAAVLAEVLKHWVLADDSGLAVDALNGARGFSRRAMPVSRAMTSPTTGSCFRPWRACLTQSAARRFTVALALADPTGAIRVETEGICRGRLTREVRGAGGFGYDPLFLIPEYHKTFGELSPLVKHQLSHRARAFARLRTILMRMIAAGEFD